MKSQTEMPTEGQFVAVWMHNGKLWSDTLKWEDGKFYCYDDYSEEDGKWVKSDPRFTIPDHVPITYFLPEQQKAKQ